MLKYYFLSAFLGVLTFALKSQDPCTYSSTSKKGGSWVFSTFYQPNTQTPLDGVCEQKNGNAPFLYRSFKSGRLKKEVLYSTENKLVSFLEIYDKRRDSIIGEYKHYGDNGNLMHYEVFYLDKNKRRCVHRISFHINGNTRFDQYFAWIKESELTEYQKPNHPPHTIDEDGYTYLQVPFGLEKTCDTDGKIIEEKYHQLLIDGTDEFASLNGPAFQYHANGKIKEKRFYQSGKLHGDFVEFNFLGDTISIGNYDQGLKNGLWIFKHDNGNLKAVHLYNTQGNYPFQAQKDEWSENGQLILQFRFDEKGSGKLQEWTENGVLIHEQELVNLSVDKGKETFWFPNGQMKSVMNHTQNADVVFQEWYESGRNKMLKRKFTQGGNQITANQEWYSNGNLKDEIELLKSEFVTTYTQRKYYENGNFLKVDIRKNREQFIEDYATNGIKIREIKLLDGKIHGRFLELDSTGQIKVDINYQNGIRHGTYRVYNNAVLSYEATYENGVWMRKNEKTNPFLNAFQKLKAEEKQIFNSAAYYLLNRQLHAPEPLVKSFGEVDTLASVIWQMSRLAPHFPDWASSALVKKQVLRIRLIETYHSDIKSNTPTSKFSKELLAGLTKLNVQLPEIKFINGETYVNIELKNWINMARLKQIFPENFSLMQVYNPLQNESAKYSNSVRYFIEMKTSNTWKITLHHEMDAYHILLYGDGTAEIENQAMSWSDFLKLDLTNSNKHPKWFDE